MRTGNLGLGVGRTRGRTRATASSPIALISGLQYCDIKDASTLTVNADGRIEQVTAKNSGGPALTPRVAGTGQVSQPAYSATSFNGGPGLTFSAANATSLKSALLSVGGNAACAFMSVIMTSPAATERVVSFIGDTETTDWGATTSSALIARSGTTSAITSYRGAFRGSATITEAVPVRVGCVYDGTNVIMYANNVAGTSAAVNLAFAATGRLNFGSENLSSGASGSNMVVQRIAFLPRAPTSDERSTIDAWLSA